MGFSALTFDSKFAIERLMLNDLSGCIRETKVIVKAALPPRLRSSLACVKGFPSISRMNQPISTPDRPARDFRVIARTTPRSELKPSSPPQGKRTCRRFHSSGFGDSSAMHLVCSKRSDNSPSVSSGKPLSFVPHFSCSGLGRRSGRTEGSTNT